MQHLSQILPELCRGLDLDQKVREMSVLALWSGISVNLLSLATYPDLLQNTKAQRIKKKGSKTVLYVKVTHAVLASELSFHTLALLDAFNGFSPQTGIQIDQIQWVVGSIGK